MFRVSRFFISEIVAGENILKDGFFPVCREGEKADHGVLFAPNGSCKTTLLSFLLSVFCPEKRRFVQHLQSSGDKNLEQYLIPGRPAVVLLDLVITLEPTLFESEPEENIVIGQLLYQHKNAPGRIDRLYFTAKEKSFFDSLRREWKGFLEEDHPHAAARDYILPQVLHTTSQREWEDKLESLGLDPWLINRQVDFARTEGGIKDAFKFKEESDFLSYFLGCVTDLDSAVKLRETASTSIEKMRNRPEKKAQLKSLWKLREKISGFDEMGKRWRDSGREERGWRLKLGEARHILNKAKKIAAKRLDDAGKLLEKWLNQKREAQKRIDLITVNSLQVKERDVSTQILDLERNIGENKALVLNGRLEQAALKASEYKEEIRNITGEVSNLNQALSSSDEKLAPLRVQTELRAAQFHFRLKREKAECRLGLDALQEKDGSLNKERDGIQQEIRGLREQLQDVQGEMERLLTFIGTGVEAFKTFELNENETPEEGEKRLELEIKDLETKIGGHSEKIAHIRKTLDELSRKWEDFQRLKANLEVELNQALKEADQEREMRHALLSDANLKMAAGRQDFDPASRELAVRLQESSVRQEEKLARMQRKDHELEFEIRRLGLTDSLAVDDDTRKLIGHYLENGFQAAEIKAFPDYLAAVNPDPLFLSEYLKKDPGRFTGIMASSDQVIERIMDAPVPEWLVRPVVISVPCSITIDEVPSLVSHVITPSDPMVYTVDYIKQRRETLCCEKDELEKEIRELRKRKKSNEESLVRLGAYQERFSGEKASELLSQNLGALEKKLKALSLDILDIDKKRLDSEEEKNRYHSEIQNIKAHKAARIEHFKQLKAWMRQYGDLDEKRKRVKEVEKSGIELKNKIESSEKKERAFTADINSLLEKITLKKADAKNLDRKVARVPLSSDSVLDEEKRDEAIAMNLDSLEKLYLEALDCEKDIAGELGVGSIKSKLEELLIKRGVLLTELEDFQKENPCDSELIDHWASRSSEERLERNAELAAVIEDAQVANGKNAGLFEGLEEKRDHCRAGLRQYSEKGITATISDEELRAGDPEALLFEFNLELSQIEEETSFLEKKIPEQQDKLTLLEEWGKELALGNGLIHKYEAYWDEHSPRQEWTSCMEAGHCVKTETFMEAENPIKATQLFLELVKNSIRAEEKAREDVEKHRKNMSSSFERLQTDLRDEKLQIRLPSIVDELRKHDAESLGRQSSEMMQKCGNLATNIESDLARSDRFMKSLIDTMLQHVKECHRKLWAASKVLMPENVYIYGGKAILKSGGRLDFKRYDDIFRESVENWLHELIEQKRMPEVNSKLGNVMGSELMYRLLRAVSGKKEFGIRLLKCDDTGKRYEQVGKDLGSGGEALTTAVLLYSLLTSMRQKRRNRRDDRLPAFLIADNPLGVCNRSDFLDAQLKVAEAMGIQCIYFTGINDTESLGLFEHRIAIVKNGRKLTIDGNNYSILEVVEQNVEKKR